MKTRIISAICMLPLLLFLYLGGLPLFFTCLVFSIIGMYEFYNGFKAMGQKVESAVGYLSLALLYLIIYLRFFAKALSDSSFAYSLLAWLFVSIASCLAVSLFKKDHTIFDGPLALLGVLYIGFFCSHIVLTERIEGSLVWLIFLSAFGTDILAYFTGYFLGKHKLCPKLSPKKTVEGAIGGIFGSILFCLVFSLITNPEKIGLYSFAGLLASPLAQAGDLIASSFKRKMGIKDYGKLIPGHGGIMDRIDSVLFTAPFIYYFMLIFGEI